MKFMKSVSAAIIILFVVSQFLEHNFNGFLLNEKLSTEKTSADRTCQNIIVSENSVEADSEIDIPVNSFISFQLTTEKIKSGKIFCNLLSNHSIWLPPENL